MTWTKSLGAIAFFGLSLSAGMTILVVPSNPGPDQAKGLAMPPDVEKTLRRSCFDCHSNETRWPWYSRVWPVSSMIESDVSHGRAAMNFSNWPPGESARDARLASGLLMASCAALQEGLMPKPQYLAIHRDAKMSIEEKQRFCAWAVEESAAVKRAAR